MSGEKDQDTVEIDGLAIPMAAVEEAEKVIFEWNRGSDCRATDEVVKIYKIIAAAAAYERSSRKP